MQKIEREDFDMKDLWNGFQIAIAAIGGGLGYFLGGYDGFLYTLIVFVILDYITGLMCAILDKKLSSEIGFRGIFKKVLIFIMVGVGHLVDSKIIGGGSVLRTAIIFFYCSNEGVSLLENASRVGLPVPEKLKDILIQLHDKGEKDND